MLQTPLAMSHFSSPYKSVMHTTPSHLGHYVLAALFVNGSIAYARAAERDLQGPRAHQHGVADLRVTLDKSELTVVVEGPTDTELLRIFPHAKELRAHVVTAATQKAVRLRSGGTRLTLAP